jgi:HEPN domain-containing protein
MKPLTSEWVKKAEGDFISAKREYRARKQPNHDSACFHAQQCIEKYLKACLQEADIPTEKTHNLLHLLDSVVEVEPMWEAHRTSLAVLNSYAVTFRYPGEDADRETARDALRICSTVRRQIRRALGLAEDP